jgi:hypothetical protein
MPIESSAVCAKPLTPPKSGQRQTGHHQIQKRPQVVKRGQHHGGQLHTAARLSILKIKWAPRKILLAKSLRI